MISTTTQDILSRIKQGRFEPAHGSDFESLSAKTFVEEVLIDYPLIFQQRSIGRKQEIGLAKEVIYQFCFRKSKRSMFHSVQLFPVLHRCLLVSHYDDVLSEITWANAIDVMADRNDAKRLRLRFGAGRKVDKTIDGWTMKPLLRRTVSLSEIELHQRGFQFDVLPPFGQKTSVFTP